MKSRPHLAVLGVFLACTVLPEHAHARGPSTPEERARVIELTKSLERDPLTENAAATRQWLRTWIAEVPDIRFMVCDDLLGHALGHNYPYSSEVQQQVLFSGASFTLQHQDKARSDITVYHAGVEGALRVYEVLLKSKPDAKVAFLDDLVAKRDQGQLFDYVGKLSKEKCKRSNVVLIAAPAGAAVGFVLALLIAWLGGWPKHGVTLKQFARSNRIVNISQWVVFIEHYHGGVSFIVALSADRGMDDNVSNRNLARVRNACSVHIDRCRCWHARDATTRLSLSDAGLAFNSRAPFRQSLQVRNSTD